VIDVMIKGYPPSHRYI